MIVEILSTDEDIAWHEEETIRLVGVLRTAHSYIAVGQAVVISVSLLRCSMLVVSNLVLIDTAIVAIAYDTLTRGVELQIVLVVCRVSVIA